MGLLTQGIFGQLSKDDDDCDGGGVLGATSVKASVLIGPHLVWIVNIEANKLNQCYFTFRLVKLWYWSLFQN